MNPHFINPPSWRLPGQEGDLQPWIFCEECFILIQSYHQKCSPNSWPNDHFFVLLNLSLKLGKTSIEIKLFAWFWRRNNQFSTSLYKHTITWIYSEYYPYIKCYFIIAYIHSSPIFSFLPCTTSDWFVASAWIPGWFGGVHPILCRFHPTAF